MIWLYDNINLNLSSYLYFEVCNNSSSTHLEALAIWGRNVIATIPLMHLLAKLLGWSLACLGLVTHHVHTWILHKTLRVN
jgi:hypothetical protein